MLGEDAAACGFWIGVITAQSNYRLKKIVLISVCVHVHCMAAGTGSTKTEVLYLAAWQVQPAAMKD